MSYDYVLMKDKLKGEYSEAYDKVYMYATTMFLDRETDEDMMMNLLDMMLTAQNEGKPVKNIIGNDIEEFCKSYFEECGPKEILRGIADYFKRIAIFVVIISIMELLVCMSEEGFSLWKATTDVSGFFIGMAIAVITNFGYIKFVKPFIFKWKKVNVTLISTLTIVICIALIVLAVILVGDRVIAIPLVPTIAVSALYLVIYYAFRIRKNLDTYGSIRKPKEKKIKFSEHVESLIEDELPKELAKRYDKENKKLAKKGKPAMTPEEYMDKLRIENKKMVRNTKLSNVGLVAFITCIVGYAIVMEAIHGEGIVDLIIYTAVLLIIEIPIMKFGLSLNTGADARIKIFEECDKQGIDILEYANRIEMGKSVEENDENIMEEV